jgi:RNA polymerase sigma-70 factor (ECF subfamily)
MSNPRATRETHPSQDDAAWVTRANAGDGDALESLYAAHRDWVVGVARRIVGDDQDALDVLQEVFIYLFSKFPGFTLTASMRSFLYPVIKHKCISVIRKRKKTVDLDAYRRGTSAAVPWTGTAPGGAGTDFERITSMLPDGQREVVLLRFGLDFRLDEIAAALDIPVGTVKSRLHNALKTLRNTAGVGAAEETREAR